MNYYLQDVQTFFFQSRTNEDDIQRIIKETVMKQDGEWNNEKKLEMCYTIQEEIDKKVKQFTGIKFNIPNVNIATDQAILKIYQALKITEQFSHLPLQ